MIRVLVADDHAVVREGLEMLLGGFADVELVAAADDGDVAVELAQRLRPDVILMDLSMPRMGGIETTRRIVAERSDASVVILTTFADTGRVMDSLDAGAVGYLMKDSSPEELHAGIVVASRGGSPLDPRVARTVVEARQQPRMGRADAPLTAKQTDVLRLVAEGLPNRLIGRRMGISEKTVKAHLTHVFQALGVADRVQAALWAQRNLSPP